jgi:hypothetical protein
MTMTMKKRPMKKRKSVITKRRLRSMVLLGVVMAACLSFAGNDKVLQKHYGLIFGTAYGPDDRPLYGVQVQIHPAGHKHPSWDLISDHRGEFAQRVPPGPGDYVVTGQTELLVPGQDDPHHTQKKRVKTEAKVHLEGEERQDVSLHLIN